MQFRLEILAVSKWQSCSWSHRQRCVKQSVAEVGRGMGWRKIMYFNILRCKRKARITSRELGWALPREALLVMEEMLREVGWSQCQE